MMVVAIVLAAPAPAAPRWTQLLAGPAFEDLAKRTDALCPAKRIRAITPGDLDRVQDDFAATLSRRHLARLTSANHADRRCAGRNGLACPTTATLQAMRRVGLTGRFAAYICAHPPR